MGSAFVVVLVVGPCEDVPVLVMLVAGRGPGGGSMVPVVHRALRCEVWGTSVSWISVSVYSFVIVP